MVLTSIATVLVKLFDVTPELARVVELYVKAKRAKGPGGKALTPEERAELKAALRDLEADLT